MKPIRRPRGVTLIEMLIATTILAVIIVGTLKMYWTFNQAMLDSQKREAALSATQELLRRIKKDLEMRANPDIPYFTVLQTNLDTQSQYQPHRIPLSTAWTGTSAFPDVSEPALCTSIGTAQCSGMGLWKPRTAGGYYYVAYNTECTSGSAHLTSTEYDGLPAFAFLPATYVPAGGVHGGITCSNGYPVVKVRTYIVTSGVYIPPNPTPLTAPDMSASGVTPTVETFPPTNGNSWGLGLAMCFKFIHGCNTTAGSNDTKVYTEMQIQATTLYPKSGDDHAPISERYGVTRQDMPYLFVSTKSSGVNQLTK